VLSAPRSALIICAPIDEPHAGSHSGRAPAEPMIAAE